MRVGGVFYCSDSAHAREWCRQADISGLAHCNACSNLAFANIAVINGAGSICDPGHWWAERIVSKQISLLGFPKGRFLPTYLAGSRALAGSFLRLGSGALRADLSARFFAKSIGRAVARFHLLQIHARRNRF
jgi:hypothetical protein